MSSSACMGFCWCVSGRCTINIKIDSSMLSATTWWDAPWPDQSNGRAGQLGHYEGSISVWGGGMGANRIFIFIFGSEIGKF